ncbi:hypothetical protein AB0469_26210 [Streptomyces sp. NPDC093801]|uniref:hypothetical protein n=1 Tax=Streptomyces sp. NPDC093801 TaxID=3155203 RepID=UPI003450C053
MTAYLAFRDAELKIYSTGSLDGVGDIKTIARGEALKHIQRNIAYFQGEGLVMKGRPVLSPKVQSVDLDSAPPTARIRDCEDSTNYVKIDKFTGEFKFPGNPPTVDRYVAERVDGHWIISDLASYTNEKC